LDQKLIGLFQDRYFAAFPAHRQWHARVAQELWTNGHLTTLTGRRRWFFGRRNDDATIREAIAYNPQGSVGDILNTGMLAIWRLGRVQLLLQIHDAILVQYPEEIEPEIIPLLLKTIQHPIQLKHNRTLLIPAEAKTGWNWGEFCCGDKTKPECAKCDKPANLDGLTKWSSTKPDARRRSQSSTTDLLDRVVR
jgi:DNA polymerase I-like protein with 3'-5' exonuclease and polymerase domains